MGFRCARARRWCASACPTVQRKEVSPIETAPGTARLRNLEQLPMCRPVEAAPEGNYATFFRATARAATATRPMPM
jgi:hypothetical protein